MLKQLITLTDGPTSIWIRSHVKFFSNKYKLSRNPCHGMKENLLPIHFVLYNYL